MGEGIWGCRPEGLSCALLNDFIFGRAEGNEGPRVYRLGGEKVGTTLF